MVTPVASAQNQTWVRQFGTPWVDNPYGATPDGAGGVYVCGNTYADLAGPHAGWTDAWVARYDSAGNQLWIRQLGSSEDDVANGVASDGIGGVYVCGRTQGSLGPPQVGLEDAWLARYDGGGSLIWILQFGTTNGAGALCLATDGSGGAYVGGYASGSIGGPVIGGADAWLARFDATGAQLWIRQFGTDQTEYVKAAAPDGLGGVFVGGHTKGNFGGPVSGNGDAWLARYDGAGNQTWVQQFGSIYGDVVNVIVPDASGGVFAGGYSASGPPLDIYDSWLARHDGAGNQSWYQEFGGTGRDEVTGGASDGAGGLIACGYTHGDLFGPTSGSVDGWFARYDGAGAQTWVRRLGAPVAGGVAAAAPDGAGGVYLLGFVYSNPGMFSPHHPWWDISVAHYERGLTAARYCTPAAPNSTGQPSLMNATGESTALANDVTLEASQLPPQSFGYFLTSRAQDFVAHAGGSQGNLCVGGQIGRYIGPGQVMSSGAVGSFALAIDLTQTPQPTGSVAVQSGDTWNFQAWHRDAIGGAATSNFTDAVSIRFD